MTRKNNRLSAFLNSPTSVRYWEIKVILTELGCTFVETKGSHKKIKHPLFPRGMLVPVHKGDCKNVYKKLIAKRIKIFLL